MCKRRKTCELQSEAMKAVERVERAEASIHVLSNKKNTHTMSDGHTSALCVSHISVKLRQRLLGSELSTSRVDRAPPWGRVEHRSVSHRRGAWK
jgi:hypothetical protein